MRHGRRALIAFISRSSLRMTPSYPSSSRSNRWTIAGDSVAGRSSSKRRHQHVRGHDERDLLADGGAKRLELHRAQTVGRMLDQRQLDVRIGAGVAVPGKVLAARRHALGSAASG